MYPLVHLSGQETIFLSSSRLELRKFLDSRGATMQLHSSKRIILTLAQGTNLDVENREAAIQTAMLVISRGRPVRNELPLPLRENHLAQS